MNACPTLLACASALLLSACTLQAPVQEATPPAARPLDSGAGWSSEHMPVAAGYRVEEEVIPVTPELNAALNSIQPGLGGYVYPVAGGERLIFTYHLTKVPTDGGHIVGFPWESQFTFKQLRRYRVIEKDSGELVCTFNAALVAQSVPGSTYENQGELLWGLTLRALEAPARVKLRHAAYFCSNEAGSKLQLPQGQAHDIRVHE